MAGQLVPLLCSDMQSAIEAMMNLRDQGPALHSRKLRAFDEPPFR
jgi:AMP nucleosidase